MAQTDHRGGGTRDCGEVRVDGDDRDAQVRGAERRPRIEPHPSEQQDERAGHDFTKTMLCAGKARGLPSLSYLPVRGPRMIASAMAAKPPPTAWTTWSPRSRCSRGRARAVEPHCDIQRRHPRPAAEDGVQDRAHEELGEQEGPERDALADRPTMM